MAASYPSDTRERDKWILSQRKWTDQQSRNNLNPQRPYFYLAENERSKSGEILRTATIFLTNKECPWRCLMCDLWINTLTQTVPKGAIPTQIDYALDRLGHARQIKLYNNGSFFDHRAIPINDYEAIAARLGSFERVIVESHPALINDDCLRLRDLIKGQLEVAMGLETVHPLVGPRLNKRMTLEKFASAAEKLQQNDVDLRVFILVKPPFLNDSEALYWAERSIDFAFDCGATVAVLIPTRPGNGALETLKQDGQFSPPSLKILERAAAYGVQVRRGRVFADLWDLERFATCTVCFSARSSRLHKMNLQQEVLSSINCQQCNAECD
jgi:archaeosine synthase beta-subunit